MRFAMPSCGGCGTCELACSLHHTGEFSPAVSSLKVLAREEGQGYHIILLTQSDGQSLACDSCKGLDVPLCLDYCKESDDLGRILMEFEEKRKAGHGKPEGG